jgi:hypothetical protein
MKIQRAITKKIGNFTQLSPDKRPMETTSGKHVLSISPVRNQMYEYDSNVKAALEFRMQRQHHSDFYWKLTELTDKIKEYKAHMDHEKEQLKQQKLEEEEENKKKEI